MDCLFNLTSLRRALIRDVLVIDETLFDVSTSAQQYRVQPIRCCVAHKSLEKSTRPTTWVTWITRTTTD